MPQRMHITALATFDTAFTLYMGKVWGSASDVKKFPTPQQLNDSTPDLLNYVERNFVEKTVDENGVWGDVPPGKGSVWNLEATIAIALYCAENLQDVKISKAALPYAYNAIIDSRVSVKHNPKLSADIHIIPALFEDESIDDYPEVVLTWIDLRFRFLLGSMLSYLRSLGAPVVGADEFQVSDWDELAQASFETMDVKKDMATEHDGGELEEFSRAPARDLEIDLMAMGGDEHVSLYASNFDGVYYLADAERVEEAKKAQDILKGYWDICQSSKRADECKQSLLDDVREGRKLFKEEQEGKQRAGITIIK